MIDASPDLVAFLKEEHDRCLDETLADERETAIDRYNGQPYGDEEDGRSQVVARDTAEVVDYMVISILRTIVSGDRIVEFAHKNAEAAHQATETIMYLLMDEQDGYQILHDWLKAGLLEKTAVAMTYPEERQPKRRTLEGVSAMAMMVAEQQGAKIIESEQVGEGGEEGPLFNVTVLEERGPKFCDAAVPNEEFYCSPDARTIDEAPLKGRRVRRSISDLVSELKIDPSELEGVAEAPRDDTLSQARDGTRYVDVGTRRGSARMIWWHEDFVRFDANGDGIAELLYVQRTADYKIFSIDEMEDVEDHPFEDWCPFPMQHRRTGQSLADKVMDIERINTVLTRQSLDGIYLSNNPVIDLHEDSIGENTIEDLLTVRPGRIRRYKGNVGPPTSSQIRFDPGAGFQMLEYMDRRRETRTGITRLNQGLDAETINDTARGQAQLQERGDQVEEYVARNFANALARLVSKKARLLRRYGQPIMVPIDGEYVEVDPRQWPEDMIARPRLGLGASRKEKRIAYRREVIAMQAQAMEVGMDIVDEGKFFNSAKGLIKDAGLGDVTEYFNDPSKPQLDENGQPIEKQPKPDPEMAKVQAQVEAKKMEMALKQQLGAQQLELKRAEAEARLETLRQQGAQKAQIDAQKAQFDSQLAQARASFEADLAERQMQIDAMLKVEQINAQERSQARMASMRKNRAGGRLDK